MKITQSKENISPFGGFNFCYDLFRKTGIPSLINAHLGKRTKYVGFDYSDIFTNHMAVFLHAGDMCFYIRTTRCASMEQPIGVLLGKAWKKIRLGVQEMEVAEINNYQPFGEKKAYRRVVSRIKRKDKQTGLFTGTSYTYRAVITNDKQWDSKQITSFYNQRASSEKTFDVMNNDFGWSKLPCSFLGENTSFMIMTSRYANFYTFMVSTFTTKISWLEANFRLKKFVFRFITVATKWIKTGRQ